MNEGRYAYLCYKCTALVKTVTESDATPPTLGAMWVLCVTCATPELVAVVGAILASDNLVVKTEPTAEVNE